MSNPAFNPGHHPILDLEPHEFVRRANEAGIKLAKKVAFFDESRNCGCGAGVATRLALPGLPLGTVGYSLRLIPGELHGITNGFDASQDKAYLDTPQYAAGHRWGSAIRAAALEIQGDLDPDKPLVAKGADA